MGKQNIQSVITEWHVILDIYLPIDSNIIASLTLLKFKLICYLEMRT